MDDSNKKFYKRPIKRFNNWLDSQHWLLQIIILGLIVVFVRTFVFGLYWVPTGSMEPTILVGEVFFADKLTNHFRTIKHGDIVSFNQPNFNYSENYFKFLFEKYIYGPENWTKRVIGIPNDKIQGKIENGRPVIYRNGEKLEETYKNRYPLIKVVEKSMQLSMPLTNKGLQPLFKENVTYPLRTFDESIEITSDKQPFYRITEEEIYPNINNKVIYYPNTPHSYDYGRSTADEFDIILKENEYWLMGDNRRGSYDSRGFSKIERSFIHGRILFRLLSFDTTNSLLYEILVNPIKFLKKFRSYNRWFSLIK